MPCLPPVPIIVVVGALGSMRANVRGQSATFERPLPKRHAVVCGEYFWLTINQYLSAGWAPKTSHPQSPGVEPQLL